MKIAVIGGAGVRTPLLVSGLTASDLPIDEIALYDPDEERLRLIGTVARHLAQARLTCHSRDADAIDGADFVFLSIRVGGIRQRGQDELISLEHGFVSQETVGPAGFAMAMRTIPRVVGYARAIERIAPHAWVINFTNPVGIVTQAMQSQSRAKIIGICDTPTELFEDVAAALELDPAECCFDYFGLNHLGWLREVRVRGVPQLHRVWRDPSLIDRIYRAPLFEHSFIQRLRLLPTEYLFYYYRPEEAIERTRRAGLTRGQAIESLNASLFRDLAQPGAEVTAVYGRYLAARNAGYLQIESGREPATRSPRPGALAGYDRIAAGVVRAIHFNTNTIIPLSVRNAGNLPDLDHDDVVEVPCVVNRNGAAPLHIGPVAEQVRDLLVRVKAYERLTVDAALGGSPELARTALATNPLVGNRERAAQVIAAFGSSW